MMKGLGNLIGDVLMDLSGMALEISLFFMRLAKRYGSY